MPLDHSGLWALQSGKMHPVHGKLSSRNRELHTGNMHPDAKTLIGRKPQMGGKKLALCFLLQSF